MTEPNVEPSGAPMNAADPGPAGDNQADGEKSGLFEADTEGSTAGADSDTPDTFQPEPESEPVDPGVSPEMISALAATEIPENLAEHWDHNAALKLYDEALKEGIAPEVLSKLMNSFSKGQSERLPQMMEAAQEQADAQMDEATAAHAAQSRRALQHEWKDGFTSKVKTARDAAENLFGHDELQRLVQTELKGGGKLGDLPAFVKALHKMGGKMSLESSAELAQQELDEQEGDEDFNRHFFDKSNTRAHRAAVEKRDRTFARAYPEEAPAQAATVTAEARTEARTLLTQYAENKKHGAELSKAMTNLDAPQDRPEQEGRVLARFRELNRISEAPVASSGANQMSRDEAKAEITRLEKDPDHWKEPTAGAGLEIHRARMARLAALYAIAHPD